MAGTSDIATRYFTALSAHGHADPLTGEVRRQLQEAAEAP